MVDGNRLEGPDFDDVNETGPLVDYIIGAATPGERGHLEARMSADPALRAQLEEIRLLWEHAAGGSGIENPKVAVRSIQTRVSSLISASPPAADAHVDVDAAAVRQRTEGQASTTRRWTRARYTGLIAASILLVLAIGLWSSDFRREAQAPPTGPARLALREIVAGVDGRTVVLSDGTRITLAPRSVIRAPVDLTAFQREVELEGQAYFQVAHDAERPFLVRTSRALTRVLGTEFAVRAVAGTEETEVIVRTGRVAIRSSVHPEAAARVLGGGDRGRIQGTGEIQVQSGVDIDAALAWTAGTLAFRGTPLRDVVLQLEQWYGIRIRLANPGLEERRITATFTNEPVEIVLQTVADLLDLRWQRTGQEVVFSPI
jgi:transmembrane sensor